MTEVFRTTGVDTSKLQAANENYKENRSFQFIQEVARKYLELPFEDYLKELSKRFSRDISLQVIEGGCGTGNFLEGIQRLSPINGKEIVTIGIDKAERNLPIEPERNKISKFILGSVQGAYDDGLITDNTFHFGADFCGAFFYDFSKDGSRGREILPIYRNILKPGGTLFLFAYELDPLADWMRLRGDRVAQENHEHFMEFLDELDFRVVRQKSVIALLESR